MELQVGQVLKAYRILERVGAGGFGAVYRAIQVGIEREVAIKIILPEYANHPDFIRRFDTEAQLVARLEHPHIVPLYDYWREPNSACLVMRYLRGGSVRDSLLREEQWTAARVAQMLVQMGSALTFAHNSGVIHRDLKSDNILLDEHGNFYLVDFGIAKDTGSAANLTKDSILGTPAYLAPEQIRGEIASAQSDIYALGIVAYESLTGSKPFFDESAATVLFKQLSEPLPDLNEKRPDLPDTLNFIIQRATSKDPADRYTTALEFALEFQRATLDPMERTPTSNLVTERTRSLELASAQFQAKNPYKGLRAFQQADSADFFGRETLIKRLLDRLMSSADHNNFLAVVGPSGSGKSSVVKAGLMPAIQQGALGSETRWFVTEMVPGTHPFEELEAALLSIAPTDIPNLHHQLEEDERGFARVLKRIITGEESRLVLLIDQFEEIFTMVENEGTRVKFLNAIMEVINDPRSRAKIIITIRADFYDKPLLYPRFGELIRTRTELVLPLSEEELEEAISGPATRVGAVIEPGLIQTIKEEVSQEPGALPLLQYALTELFERRAGNRLTLEAYRQIGGTSGALARRAEEVYQSFDPATQETARQMFLRLVTLGDGTEDTRRRVLQTELLSIQGEQGRMQKVMNSLGRYRLLTFDHDQQSRSATIEVAHEALIRRWERLRSWLDENREALRLQRRLAAAAEEWRRTNNEKSFLARGVQLQQFEDQINSGTISLNALESDYLDASIAARDAQVSEEEAREEDKARQAARERALWRAGTIIMTVFTLVVGVMAVYAFSQRDAAASAQLVAEGALGEAQRSAEVARLNASEAQSLALSGAARNAQNEGNMPLALTLALKSAEVFETPVAEVMRVLSMIAYAPGVRYRLENDKGSTIAAHFSADGTRFITATADGQIRVKETRTAEEIQTLTLPDARITDALLSPDGSLIAVSLADNTIRLYDATSAELVRTLTGHTESVMDIDFSTDGARLVSGSLDRTVRLWDVQTGENIRTFVGHVGAVLRVDYAASGTLIASSSADETVADTSADKVERVVKIWEVATGLERLTIEPASGFVRAIAFRPDSQIVAVGVWDSSNRGTIRFYDTINGQETSRLFAHANIISDIAYSANGLTLVSAGWDGDITLWDIRRSLQLMRFVGFNDRILSLDYSPTSDYLILGSGNAGNNEFIERGKDTSAWLVDLKNRDEMRSYTASKDWVWSAALSPDGTLTATGSGPLRLPAEGQPAPDTGVRVWNTQTGETVYELKGHTNTVDAVAFLDDTHLISGGWDAQIILWDLQTGKSLRTFTGHEDKVYKLSVSPDHTQLLSASADGSVRLWTIETGELVRTYNVPDADSATNDVNGVAFAPDGKTFVSGGSDKAVHIWDATSDRLIMTLQGHTESVNETIYSPDGTQIASSSWDDSVRLWDPTTGTEVRRITGHNGNTFGLAYTADGQYLLSTSQDMTIRVWHTTTGDELHRFAGHGDWIQEVVVSPDGRFLVSGAQDRTARIWRLDLTPDQVVEFATQNRYMRPLLCQEEEVYQLGSCVAGA